MSKTPAPYTRYLAAAMLPTPRGRYSDLAIREMQAAMFDALRSGDPLPEEMRRHLAMGFESVCEGIADDLLTPVKRAGGREAPIAKHTHQAAIQYLRWCADGRINDANAVRTVANAYDIDERTVRAWRAKWRDSPTPALFDEYGPEQVTKFMKATGKVYRRFIPKPTPKR